jgi:hypothetical protein
MIIRIASILLRLCAGLALILGLLFWGGMAREFLWVHMLLGMLLVLLLWVIGIGQAFTRGGSWALAIIALAVGLLVIGVGLNQTTLLVGPFHWVIQVLHLLLGMLAAGTGQIIATRSRKVSTAVAGDKHSLA